jgi:hypothetical protein
VAYSKQLICRVAYCGKPARVEVFSWRNESEGQYCAPCGKAVLGIVKNREASTPPKFDGTRA